MHEGHRERLKKRFLQDGLENFEEHNALELLLFYARPRCDTNPIAHALINKFGSFAKVLDAPIEEIAKVPGMGITSATFLKMIPAMGAYYQNSRSLPGTIIASTAQAGEFFKPKFFGKTNEAVYIALLDDRQKVLRTVCISEQGISNAVGVSVKRIVAEAVSADATGVIMAHNHPSGIPLPSQNDKQVTKKVNEALKMINIHLNDHIIVSGDDFVSMADSGFMQEMDY